VNQLLTQLRPDQAALVHSVVSDLAFEGVHTRKELQLLLESELDWQLQPPETALALRNLIHDLDTPGSHQQPLSVSTLEIADKLLTSKRAASLQPRSIENYRQVLHSFAIQYPTLPSRPEEIEAFLTSKPSDSTRLWVYRVLSVLYKFANQRFGVPNIMVTVQKPRVKLKEPNCLTGKQAKMLLCAIRTDRERALAYLYLGQGLRLSEALRLDIQDVGEDLLRIKGKERDESMPLLPEVRDALLKLTGNHGHNEPVFIGQRGRLGRDMAEKNIKNLFQRAGVNVVQQSPKILRSTFASMAFAAGCDFHIVKRLLRHSGGWDVTDRHYLHLTNHELRQKLQRYSPLRLLNQDSDKLLEGQSH
jgi:integrase